MNALLCMVTFGIYLDFRCFIQTELNSLKLWFIFTWLRPKVDLHATLQNMLQIDLKDLQTTV